MMGVAVWPVVFVLSLAPMAPGESRAGERSGGTSSIEATSVSRLGELPASFAGDMPCADCEGIRYRLNLFEDHAFYLGMRYLGRGDQAVRFDIGTWALSDDRRILVLIGGREAPLMFRIGDADTLHKLDIEGRDIDSTLNYSLTRTAEFERIEPQLTMRGMYRYMADAAVFTECLTGQRWPVAPLADNLALETAYLGARQAPGEAVLVTLEGRVAMRPAMEGDRLLPTLVPTRFIGVWPGERCAARCEVRSSP